MCPHGLVGANRAREHELRLIVLSCSAAKRRGANLPALELYDGPRFRLLRKYLRVTGDKSLRIAIVSARHGVVTANQRIDLYNRKMTSERARQLAPVIARRLARLSSEVDSVFVIASTAYAEAIGPWQLALPTELRVAVASRGQLERLSQMKKWLYRLVAVDSPSKPVAYRGEAVLKGKSVRMTREEVTRIALASHHGAGAAATRYRDWYVEFDGRRLSPKWLASELFGVPVQRFQAHDARRALTQLGIEVRRVDETRGES